MSIRLDPEVLDYFRAQGSGYQSRINRVLRAYVDTQAARHHGVVAERAAPGRALKRERKRK